MEEQLRSRYTAFQKLVKRPAQIERVRLTSWREYFCLFKVFSTVDAWTWAFRGQEDATWHLTTSLEREFEDRSEVKNHEREGESYRDADDFKIRNQSLLERNEVRVIDAFRAVARAHGVLQGCGERSIDVLALMQHYGSKTRLLDFSYSFAIATYFAFERRMTGKCRSVWAINLDALLAKMEMVKQEIFNDKARNEGMDVVGRRVWPQNLVRCFKDQFLNVADRVLEQHGEVRCGVIPIPVDGNNKRLVAQNGTFLFPLNNNKSFEENLAEAISVSLDQIKALASEGNRSRRSFGSSELHDATLLKIDFDPCMEEQAWRVLEQLNVLPRNVYPDLTGIAKSVHFEYDSF